MKHDEHSPSFSRKRGAGDQLTKESQSDDETQETKMGNGSFDRADEGILSRRRFVKGRRPEHHGSMSNGDSPSTAQVNPFGAGLLTACSTVTSQGAGTVSVETANGKTDNATVAAASPAADSTPAFEAGVGVAGIHPGSGPGLGSTPVGFASYTKLNPFAAASVGSTGASSGFGFSASQGNASGLEEEDRRGPFRAKAEASQETEDGGYTQETEDLEAEPSHTTYNVPKVIGLKDASYIPPTGEEQEICVLNLRTKLYRLTEVKRDEREGGACTDPGAFEATSAASGARSPLPKKDWVEAGVGQVKVLVPSASAVSEAEGKRTNARIVMRRDPGTSILLNMLLKEPVGVAKHAEKVLRLTCLEQIKPATYLMRFKLHTDMEQLLTEIEKHLALARQGQVPKIEAKQEEPKATDHFPMAKSGR